jgi:hypothetical protein
VARIAVRTDPALGSAEAIIELDGRALARAIAPRGSPSNPLDAMSRAAKIRGLAGGALAGALGDLSRPADDLRGAAGL